MFSLKAWVVVWILMLGFILRLHNYDIYPQRGATSDEYTYSFLGVSLLTIGVPISWSYFSPYPVRFDLTIDNLYFPMKFPYFDHPPLNGLVVGSWAILNGEDSFEKITLKTIRLVPIFLSVISSVLLFLIGKRLYDYKTGLIGLLIYSTVTIFVIQSRAVLAENLLTPLALCGLYLWLIWREKLNDQQVLILGIIAGLSFWAKELGIFVFFSFLYLFLFYRVPIRLIVILCLTAFIFVMLYIIYGAYYSWDSFTAIIAVQSSRYVGPQTLRLLFTPVMVNKVYFDGWYLFGLLAFFFNLVRLDKNRDLAIPATIYFMLMIFSLIREGEMGWYMIPMFPFMALFSAQIIASGFSQKSWTILLLLLTVGLYQVEYVYEAMFGLTGTQFRIILALLFGWPVITFLLPNPIFYKRTVGFLVFLLITITAFMTYFYIHPA